MTSPRGRAPFAQRAWSGPIPIRRLAAAVALLLGVAVLAAGCGSNDPGVPNGSNTSTTGSTGGDFAKYLAYSRCMRSHGIHDFPDPTTGPGGAVAIQTHGGPGSDLDHNNPRYQAANRSCKALLPAGSLTPTASPQKLATEVKWARCMRSHGLPTFPDPNSQGAFNRNKIDENSPAFQTARSACKSLHPGPTPVSP
jgi:hypothetical protein